MLKIFNIVIMTKKGFEVEKSKHALNWVWKAKVDIKKRRRSIVSRLKKYEKRTKLNRAMKSTLDKVKTIVHEELTK